MPIARRALLAGTALGLTSPFVARSAFAAEKDLAIGVSIPLTGPGAATGITTQRTLEHGVETINAQALTVGGDVYKLKMSFYDNKYVPAEAVTIVEKLLADGTRFLISLGSGNSVPVVAKTTAVKCLQMSYASGKGHLTAPEFPLSFRVAPTNETAWAVYPWLRKTFPNVQKVGHMNPSDEAGFTESEDRRMIAEKNGFTNIANEFFKRGAADFYPVATRLAAANPDLIDFGGSIGRDQALGCKALRELGYKGMIMLGYSDVKSFVEVATPEAAEGTILFDTLVDPQNDAQKELQKWWLDKYGTPFPTFAYSVWDTPFILAEGIRKAKSVDPEAIANAMHGMSWVGLYGPEAFGMKSVYGIDSTITRAIPMAQVKGGKPVQLAMVEWPVNV
jgi:branched-chain amino acid transport system substrate-binding protein